MQAACQRAHIQAKPPCQSRTGLFHPPVKFGFLGRFYEQKGQKAGRMAAPACTGDISPDGKYMFFGRGSLTYWVRADFISTLH